MTRSEACENKTKVMRWRRVCYDEFHEIPESIGNDAEPDLPFVALHDLAACAYAGTRLQRSRQRTRKTTFAQCVRVRRSL